MCGVRSEGYVPGCRPITIRIPCCNSWLIQATRICRLCCRYYMSVWNEPGHVAYARALPLSSLAETKSHIDNLGGIRIKANFLRTLLGIVGQGTTGGFYPCGPNTTRRLRSR